MTIFEELKSRIIKKADTDLRFDKISLTTMACFQEMCNILDEKLLKLETGTETNNTRLSDGKAYLAFELSMPSNNSWNSKWTGEDKKYIITRQIDDPEAAVIYNHAPYWHDFQNNWIAQVDITRITNLEAEQLEELSDGFCGYDWMIDSIIKHGRIKPSK